MASFRGELVPTSMSAVTIFDMSVPTNETWWTDLIHPYWRQFDVDKVPDVWHYMVAVWMTFFGILGVMGNGLVIWIFCRTKSLRSPTNMLIVNLAFSDLMFSATNGFPLLTISSLNKKWVWGKLWCEIYGFTGGLFGFISINTLAWVSFDRYNVIAKPMTGARMSHKRAFGIIVLVWCWALLWSLPPFFGWGAYIPEGLQTSCTFDYLTQDINNITHLFGMYILGFFCPVMMIFFSYYEIVNSVFKHRKEMEKTAKRMGATMSKADQEKRQEIQLAKVAAVTVGSYLCAWVPYGTIGLMGMFFPHDRMFVTPLMAEIPVCLAKASAAYNPIIYALSHPRFRIAINKHFPWLLCCCKPLVTRQDSSMASTKASVRSNEPSSTISTVTDGGKIEMTPSQEPAGNTPAETPAEQA